MLGSGTESVMAALRIATDRDRITSGSSRSEGLITAGRIRWYTVLRSREAERCWNPMESRGERIRLTDEVRPNDLEMLEKMLKRNRK